MGPAGTKIAGTFALMAPRMRPGVVLSLMAVGLGKQVGAERCYEDGVPKLPENIERYAKVILKKKPVLFAVAIIENAFDETARIEAVPASMILERETPAP